MSTPRNRKPFFVILGLFFLPLALAFMVYYGSNWRPSGTTNKGDLISPAIPLPTVSLITAEGTATNERFLREDWSLVYLGNGNCEQVCKESLLKTRQAFQLLGKDMTRIKRVFLYSGAIVEPSYLNTEHVDLVKANIDDVSGQQLLASFPSSTIQPVLQAGKIYIVDPLGNLMMSYEPDVDPRHIYQDLKKLLNLSHIG
jgi:hypothetical protein